jgi:hypothetical protein
VSEFRLLPLSHLQRMLGEVRGKTLYEYARGVDYGVVQNKPRKNVSQDMSFGVRTQDDSEVEKWIRDLCAQVLAKMKDAGFRAGKLTLKVMKADENQFKADYKPWKQNGHGPCSTHNKTTSLPVGPICLFVYSTHNKTTSLPVGPICLFVCRSARPAGCACSARRHGGWRARSHCCLAAPAGVLLHPCYFSSRAPLFC